MQPYLFPYIGYFQLIASVDKFIVYDNIKYTKKGWINRNRFLQNGTDAFFTLPLKKDSDSLDVCDRYIADDFNRAKFLNQLSEAYRHAPFFTAVFPLIERVCMHEEKNLFGFIYNSLIQLCAALGIGTPIVVSSAVTIDHTVKGQDKVLALCTAMGADRYINAIGGQELYSPEIFAQRGIELKFIRSQPFEYPQLGKPFVPWLSIIDVMMFNGPQEIAAMLKGYDLI